ncbi:hypothetical protein EDD86DRAFT_64848 [Gorgonomyces haynaldii]|nr:hypothetical protein EDD86DRAFT_64848 [Gorgonomyces haynaldii]
MFSRFWKRVEQKQVLQIETQHLVNESNDKWLQYGRKQWRHPKHQTSVHLVGYQLVSWPILKQLDFSYRSKFMTVPELTIRSCFEDHDTHLWSLMVDEVPSHGLWLMNDYSPQMMKFLTESRLFVDTQDPVVLKQKYQDYESVLETATKWMLTNGEKLKDLGTDSQWLRIVAETGFVPGWETFGLIQEYKNLTGNDPYFTGSEGPQTPITHRPEQLQSDLEQFYKESNLLEHVKSIQSGNVILDGYMQQWLLEPQLLHEYQSILLEHLPLKERQEHYEQRFHGMMSRLPESGITLLATDRKSVPTFERLLYAQGWQ